MNARDDRDGHGTASSSAVAALQGRPAMMAPQQRLLPALLRRAARTCRGFARPAAQSLDKSARSNRLASGSAAPQPEPEPEPEPEPVTEEEPWFLKAGGLRFSCKPGCGRCCTGPPGAV